VLLLIAGLVLTSFRASLAEEHPKPPEAKESRTDRYGDPLPKGAVARVGTLRLRHPAEVHSVVFSLDGKSLISGGESLGSGSIRIWQVATGKSIRELGDALIGSWDLALFPDGRTLADAGDDNHIRIWDLHTKKLIREIGRGDRKGGLAVAVAPDGKAFACLGVKTAIQIYGADTGELLLRIKERRGWIIRYSPDGKLLASGAGDCVILWDAQTGKKVRAIDQGLGGFHALAFSCDGRALVTGGADNTIALWDVATGKELKRFRGHRDEVLAVAVSPDGKSIASGSKDGTVRLWDVQKGKELHCLVGHRQDVYSVAFAPDGKTLASGGYDQTVRLWDVGTGKNRLLQQFTRDKVWGVSYSPDGRLIASANWDHTVRMFDATNGEPVRVLRGHPTEVVAIAFSPDANYLVSGDWDGTRYLWDRSTGRHIREFKGNAHFIRTIALSPDSRLLASIGEDFTIRHRDLASGKETARAPRIAQLKEAWPIAFSANGKLMAFATHKLIHLWDVDGGKELCTFKGHKDDVESLVFSPDGKVLASAGCRGDTAIRLWDLATGKELRQFVGHGAEAQSLAFSPDGRLLVSGGYDATVRVWDTVTGANVGVFEGHEEAVESVAFSPDCRTVASGSDDSTIVIWDVTGRLERGRLRPVTLTTEEIKMWWDKLASQRADAHRAVWTMAAAPGQTIPFLRERLRPASPVTTERIAKLIALLDSDSFQRREQAAAELAQLEKRAEPALVKVVKETHSVEVRKRAGQLLAKLSAPIPSPARLRQIRALAVLEYCSTKEARDLLQELAKGAPDAWLTQEAKAALARLAKRPAVKP
jgi:WD40 repeat protein